MLHRPVELYALAAHWEASGSQQSARRLSSAHPQPLRNICVTYASRVYPSLSLPLDSPTAVRTSPAKVARRSCWSRGVHISMDGKGRWPGNAYVERLWRSLRKKSTGTPTRRWARPGRELPTTCVTSTRNKCLRANIMVRWLTTPYRQPDPHPNSAKICPIKPNHFSTEPSSNDRLAEALRTRNPRWTTRARVGIPP